MPTKTTLLEPKGAPQLKIKKQNCMRTAILQGKKGMIFQVKNV